MSTSFSKFGPRWMSTNARWLSPSWTTSTVLSSPQSSTRVRLLPPVAAEASPPVCVTFVRLRSPVAMVWTPLWEKPSWSMVVSLASPFWVMAPSWSAPAWSMTAELPEPDWVVEAVLL